MTFTEAILFPENEMTYPKQLGKVQIWHQNVETYEPTTAIDDMQAAFEADRADD